MAEPLEDLAQRWAEESVQRDPLAPDRGSDHDGTVDREVVLEQLHAEDDEDQPLSWRRLA
jgi:hypothetical protein